MAKSLKTKMTEELDEPAVNWGNKKQYTKIVGLVFILFSLLLLLSFSSYILTWHIDEASVSSLVMDELNQESLKVNYANSLGKFGYHISSILIKKSFGIGAFFVCVMLFVYGVNLLFRRRIFKWKTITYHSVFLMFFFAAVFEFIRFLFFRESFFHPGGSVGYYIAGSNGWLINNLKSIGTGAVLSAFGLAYLIMGYNLDFNRIIKLLKPKPKTDVLADGEQDVAVSMNESIFEKDNIHTEQEIETLEVDELEEDYDEEGSLDFELSEKEDEFEIDESVGDGKSDEDDDLELAIEKTVEEKTATSIQNDDNYDPTLDLSNYKFPPLSILEDHGGDKVSIDKDELERNKDQIVDTLKNYNIAISKIKATVGPTVTLYEIIPAPGVRISKIKNLEDDIALSLAALGIRIIAPIPGKGTIGIEVPNAKKETVSMKSMLSSEKFSNTKLELPIALGKNIANEIFIADLTKMPHLLMAGATGQGKSVGINAILCSLLYKKHPSQLKFVLVDPKKVELSIYNAIEKHFLAILPGEEEAIITDVQKVVATLNALCIEMDDRYNLLKDGKARNLKEYNQKFVSRKLNPNNGHKFLPYIVLVIDEFADLIMTAGKEVETPIARLAQLARAIGIHLVLATQRPSVNIITGVIKANFPARISFKVSSKIDSRTILDAGGADQLIGRGDMLFSQGNDMIRLQCAFIDTPEVEELVDFISKQQGYPTVFELPEYVDPSTEGQDRGSYGDEERDALFEDAARVIVNNQVGSTSMIQRRLKLGYNRAGRIMDQLENAGIVGPNLGSKPRDVYCKTEAELEQFLTQE
ncbi:MAG: DNA translocase FtsK 4TM domain-containing protein [Chitinophagales bacterium]|nr:DNA translocase FtsK 4TM domain-containing protein [Chitinophagales bacterium]